MGLKSERVILVTGASRGAGKGIALALAPGATVYVTGRSAPDQPGPDGLPGTVMDTAAEIERLGGRAVPVICDHGDIRQVADLIAKIGREQGRLDILVNNATALPALPDSPDQGFWERSLEDELKPLDVGLRSHYVAAHYAAPIMVEQGEGLIVNTSSAGARTYLPAVHGPTYGAGKAGSDKLAFDMAQELRPYGVAVLSIWMGLLRTERVAANIEADPELLGSQFPAMESPQFTGRLIDALAADPELMRHTGVTYWGSELGRAYGILDVDGTTPPSYRGWLGPPSSFDTVAQSWADFTSSSN